MYTNKENIHNGKLLITRKAVYPSVILRTSNFIGKSDNLINYIGVFIDERINKFQLGATIYRPWQYKTKYNKLLT